MISALRRLFPRLCRARVTLRGLIRFTGGREARLLKTHAIRPVLDILDEQLRKDKTAVNRPRKRRSSMVRLATSVTIVCVLGGLAIAWFLTTYFASTLPRNAPVGTFWGMLLFIAIPIPLMLWLFALAERVNWNRLGRRIRSKGRRAAHDRERA